MQRRHFLRTTGGIMLVLPFGVFAAEACYGGGSSGDTAAAPPIVSGSNAVYTSSIDGDHSHTFSIALSELSSPSDLSGDTSVDDGHAHSVAVTAAQLQNVELGQTIQVTTGTSESHSHVFTLVKVA
jgi:hypothetical protein